MNAHRIPIESGSPVELAALPRTTRWRAEQRGWITRDYHVRFANVRVFSDPAFAEVATPIYRMAQRCVGFASRLSFLCGVERCFAEAPGDSI